MDVWLISHIWKEFIRFEISPVFFHFLSSTLCLFHLFLPSLQFLQTYVKQLRSFSEDLCISLWIIHIDVYRLAVIIRIIAVLFEYRLIYQRCICNSPDIRSRKYPLVSKEHLSIDTGQLCTRNNLLSIPAA